MSTETLIADHPPQDGREWDCQCARCGSTVDRHSCDYCEGHGSIPDDETGLDTCPNCEGAGRWWLCISSQEFCLANPKPGRENVKRGEVEWYVANEQPGTPEPPR